MAIANEHFIGRDQEKEGKESTEEYNDKLSKIVQDKEQDVDAEAVVEKEERWVPRIETIKERLVYVSFVYGMIQLCLDLTALNPQSDNAAESVVSTPLLEHSSP